MNILIVDDDSEDAELLYEAIMTQSPLADCRVVHSVRAACELLSGSFTPQLVFLDTIMYPIGGEEALVLFSGMEHLKGTKFILTSGVLQPAEQGGPVATRADFVMTKPTDFESLLRYVHHFLSPA